MKNPSEFEDESHRFLAYGLIQEALTRTGQPEEAIRLLEESLSNIVQYRDEIFFILSKLYST